LKPSIHHSAARCKMASIESLKQCRAEGVRQAGSHRAALLQNVRLRVCSVIHSAQTLSRRPAPHAQTFSAMALAAACRGAMKNARSGEPGPGALMAMVPEKGLEPPRPCEHMVLNHACLPIPPLRRHASINEVCLDLNAWKRPGSNRRIAEKRPAFSR
jgi:hypothetical protein